MLPTVASALMFGINITILNITSNNHKCLTMIQKKDQNNKKENMCLILDMKMYPEK